MIEKVNTSQIQGFPEKTPSRQPNSAAALTGNNTDVSVQVDYASFIDRAMQTPQTDTQAVQRAGELLLSGQLESPENIRKAAKNIIEFDI